MDFYFTIIKPELLYFRKLVLEF